MIRTSTQGTAAFAGGLHIPNLFISQSGEKPFRFRFGLFFLLLLAFFWSTQSPFNRPETRQGFSAGAQIERGIGAFYATDYRTNNSTYDRQQRRRIARQEIAWQPTGYGANNDTDEKVAEHGSLGGIIQALYHRAQFIFVVNRHVASADSVEIESGPDTAIVVGSPGLVDRIRHRFGPKPAVASGVPHVDTSPPHPEPQPEIEQPRGRVR